MNGQRCVDCGEIVAPFVNGTCDIRTNGLAAYNNGRELQVVLDKDIGKLTRLLNLVGRRIFMGLPFRIGMRANGNPHKEEFRLDKVDNDGECVLRIVFCDDNGRWPEDPLCDKLFALQALPANQLRQKACGCHE